MTKDLELDIKDHVFKIKLWGCSLALGCLILSFIYYKIPGIMALNLCPYLTLLLVALFLVAWCLYMIQANVQEARFKSQLLLTQLERTKFKRKLKESNLKFYKLFDNLCCDANDLKSKLPCKELILPIAPSNTVKKWERHMDPDKIIGYWADDFSPYIIECPEQLRDTLIKLQHNL